MSERGFLRGLGGAAAALAVLTAGPAVAKPAEAQRAEFNRLDADNSGALARSEFQAADLAGVNFFTVNRQSQADTWTLSAQSANSIALLSISSANRLDAGDAVLAPVASGAGWLATSGNGESASCGHRMLNSKKA